MEWYIALCYMVEYIAMYRCVLQCGVVWQWSGVECVVVQRNVSRMNAVRSARSGLISLVKLTSPRPEHKHTDTQTHSDGHLFLLYLFSSSPCQDCSF
jgi:hypothetical protein